VECVETAADRVATITVGGALFPVVLSFTDRSRMRLLGIHVRCIPTLVNQFKQMVPTCILHA
jgi:hypothetical protein